jgi:hydroxymethylbilane synthase
VDGTMLAVAGMARLGLTVEHHPLDPAEMLPAACQGAIGLEIRLDDERILALCDAINDPVSAIAVTAERAFLAELDGSCRTPIGALATVDGGQVMLDGLVARPDGTALIRMQSAASVDDAARLGRELGLAIKVEMPLDFFAAAELGG